MSVQLTRLPACLTLIFFAITIQAVPANADIALPTHPTPDTSINQAINTEILSLVSLNLAHGRKDSLNQLLVPDKTIRSNLDDIAALLRKHNPDVVALQEADGPSVWSGNFDHVAYLAEAAGYPWYTRSDHVKSKYINFGTGLLSAVPFQDVISHDFPSTPPTLTKGFTLGQIEWQPDSDRTPITVDILSVHLDFSRKAVREQQVSDILNVLQGRKNPVIILGDFNSDWLAKDSVIKRMVACGKVHTFEPESNMLGTYKSGKHRLDWVLLSTELEFRSYRVLPDIVSDHQPVIVEVVYTGKSQHKTDDTECQNASSMNAPAS
ncbi:MAG: hypothetical protein BMS9Abin25_0381 [Gammaproteobacteria bacterium]|nr:MAG: hypothetical protein BMS9Abin25_0381 [Gammaproteobacteria bacterium]